MTYENPMGAQGVMRSLRDGDTPPLDPGGDFTPDRIDILRRRALHYSEGSNPFCYQPSHSRALLNALEEIETLQAERTIGATVGALLIRVAHHHWWGGLTVGYSDIVPSWLTHQTEQDRAAELQADRATIAEVSTFADMTVAWWCSGAAPAPTTQREDVARMARRIAVNQLRGR